MAGLDRLTALAGDWRATYQLRGDPAFETDSPTTATVVPMLGGRFARIDYTWIESGNTEEGSIVIGHEPDSGAVTVAWMDSWHNHDRLMICKGSMTTDGGIDVFGNYPGYPDGPDWGWRTVIEPRDDGWTLTMYNVEPGGEEALAVNAAYERA